MTPKCPTCGSEDIREEILGECHGIVAKQYVCYECGNVSKY